MRNNTQKSDSSTLGTPSNASNSTNDFSQQPRRTVKCCPFCGTSKLYLRSRSHVYVCYNPACKKSFPKPATRQAQINNGIRIPKYLKAKQGTQAKGAEI